MIKTDNTKATAHNQCGKEIDGQKIRIKVDRCLPIRYALYRKGRHLSTYVRWKADVTPGDCSRA